MSDSEKKSTPVKKSETKIEKTKVKFSPSVGVYILVLLSFTATAAGGYWLWENQNKNLIQQQVISHSVNKQLKQLNDQQQLASIQNIEQVKNLQTFQEKLRKNLTDIVSNNKFFRNDWLISEAEYLIQLATYRLLLEKDVTTAIVALSAAEERLAEVNDPALIKIRKILKNDLIALKNIQVVDLAGLSVTITALSNNISNLPLVTPDPKTHKITKTEKIVTNNDKTKTWQQLPAAIWKDIKDLIIVRNHQKPIKSLLAPEQHFFLSQNLTLLFEQARLALLNGNNVIYQNRLQAAKKWITQYFDLEHNVTRNMLTSIDDLRKLNINPDLPDISSTFTAVKKYRVQTATPITALTQKENVEKAPVSATVKAK